MTTALIVIGVCIALGIACMIGNLYIYIKSTKRTGRSWWDEWMP